MRSRLPQFYIQLPEKHFPSTTHAITWASTKAVQLKNWVLNKEEEIKADTKQKLEELEEGLIFDTSSNYIIVKALAQQEHATVEAKKPVYYLDEKGAGLVGLNVVENSIWVGFSTALLGVDLKPTDNFWLQTAGQQVWAALGVTAFTPLAAYFVSKFYGHDYKTSMRYATISGISSWITLTAWDITAQYLTLLYQSLGVKPELVNILAALGPGPGLPSAFIQNLSMHFLSYLLDPHFQFNAREFAFGFAPFAYISSNVWKLVFDAAADAASKSSAGFAAQVFGVVFSTLILDYLTIVAINACADYSEKKHIEKHLNQAIKEDNVAGWLETLKRTGSPVYVSKASQPQPAPQQSAPGMVSSTLNYVKRKVWG